MSGARDRLEGLIRIRRFELDRARATLVPLEAERRRRVALRDALCARIDGAEATLRERLATGLDGHRVALGQLGLATGRFSLARAEAGLESLQPRLERARAALRAARVRLRSLERLSERRAEARRARERRREQAQLDELAIERSLRARAAQAAAAASGRGEA